MNKKLVVLTVALVCVIAGYVFAQEAGSDTETTTNTEMTNTEMTNTETTTTNEEAPSTTEAPAGEGVAQ